MPMLQQQTLPEGYATIRRSKGRVEHKLRTSSTSSMEMIEMSPRRKSTNRNFDSEVVYTNRDEVFDEVDECVLDDIENNSRFSDTTKRTTFETFKPRNSIESGDDGSDKDLQQSSECFQSLPYDIIMSPLKSPQYINQLNAMRSKTSAEGGTRQFPLYSRPDSPKYGKILYNRSTSPSADSMDNSSSNSSTYSSNHHTAFQQASMMTQSLHLPSSHQQHNQQDDENVILINVHSNGRQKPPPLKSTSLNYRKSFSHVNGNGKLFNGYANDSLEQVNRAPTEPSSTMTKSLYYPSMSTSHIYGRRFATLAHPKEKFEHEAKTTTSMSERNLIQWNPILSCKIGSQTTLRTKPPVPWYELAIKKEFRQSCPPLQVIII